MVKLSTLNGTVEFVSCTVCFSVIRLFLRRFYENGFIVHGLEFEEKAILEFFKEFNFPYSKVKLSDDITVYKVNESQNKILHSPFHKCNNFYALTVRLMIQKFNCFKVIFSNLMSKRYAKF